MEQKRKQLQPHEMETALSDFKKRGLSGQVMKLVEDDLSYGLKPEEIKAYAFGKYDLSQMRVISKCLRFGCSKEAMAVIAAEGMGYQQMEIAFEFFKKGIPPETIREVVETAEQVPYRMERAFREIIKKKEQAEDAAGGAKDREYDTELVRQVGELVEKIRFQEERYDELNRRLKLLGEDESVRQELIDQNAEKDRLLSSQQDELNKANSAINRLRNEKEKLEKEMKRMQETLAGTEDKGGQPKPEVHKGKEDAASMETGSVAGTGNVAYSSMPENGIPVYYQIPYRSGADGVIRHVTVEPAKRKPGGFGFMEAVARVCFKKKSRSDIVRLVASGGLVPAQLVQIKNAMARGLTESQLEILINHNVSAEKMKEIIEIAVLENRMAQ